VIFLAVLVVAIVVVALVALVAEGVLVLPSNSPARVTISYVHLEILEGNSSNGYPWFGPSSINYTSAEGYPIQVAPGGTWTVVWTFINFDDVTHTVSKVTTPTPLFTIGTIQPALPYSLPAGNDHGALAIDVTAPSTPGVTYSVTVVVDAGAVS
jgi:apolipoprotein N-acyltransferase